MKLRLSVAVIILLVALLVVGCGTGAESDEAKSITGEDLEAMLQSEKDMEGVTLIDVRTPEEYHAGHLETAVNIPLNLLEDNLSSIEKFKDSPIIVICRSGNRSGQAQRILMNNEFSDVTNATGMAMYDYQSVTQTPFILEK